ncbi:MAG: dGTPase [Alteromonadaceae bacterium]|jgi:dGTPase
MNNHLQWHARQSGNDNHRPNDHRSVFERDRARILHSAAFRRLQAKTQILGVGKNDFYRTRLTHSLEVAQTGSSLLAQLIIKHPDLSKQLQLDSGLIDSSCLAHDIGHPPFGHSGEAILNYMMRDHGGFEGNGQTLRILAVLEPYTEKFGMNMTRRTLLGLLKYPNTLKRLEKKHYPELTDFNQIKVDEWGPAKGIFDDDQAILDWILTPLSDADRTLFTSFTVPKSPEHHSRTLYKSVDTSIMELADDIAYGVHDLEDAIVVGTISKTEWFELAIPQFKALGEDEISTFIDSISEQLFDAHHLRKDAIGQMVNLLITSVELYQCNEQFEEQLLRYNARLPQAQHQLLEILKQFVYRQVICHPQIQQVGFKGQRVVMELFSAFASDPLRLLPYNTQGRWKQTRDCGNDPHRVICDYISGMTDEYAMRMYKKMFMV